MRKNLIIFTLLLISISVFGQNPDTDFVIVDNTYPSADLVKNQYGSKPNFLLVTLTQVMAPTQISNALAGKKVVDLHVFVSTKPGTFGFCNMVLNSDNVQEYASALSPWSASVKGKVIIHSEKVFSGEKGLSLKAKLEEITGLSFSME